MDIKQLIEQAKQGDQQAFGELYALTYNKNYYTALRMLGNDEVTVNVIQDAYAKIYGMLKTYNYQSDAAFEGWTATVTANTVLGFIRNYQPQLFVVNENSAEQITFSEPELYAEVRTDVNVSEPATTELIHTTMASMTDEQRMCTMMYYIDQLSIPEIASALGCSTKAVEKSLMGAKTQILQATENSNNQEIRESALAGLSLFASLLSKDYTGMSWSAVSTQSYGTIYAAALANSAKFVGVAGNGMASTAGATMTGVGASGTSMGSAVAGTAAKAGISLGAKIAIGIATAAVVIGGGFGIKHALDTKKEKPEPATEITTEVPEEPPVEVETTESPATEEIIDEEIDETELLKSYLRDELVPAYGLTSRSTISGQVAHDTMAFDEVYMHWADIDALNGIQTAIIDDIDDMDSEPELLVFYFKEIENPQNYQWDDTAQDNILKPFDGRATQLMYDFYEVAHGQVVLTDSGYLSFLKMPTDDSYWNQNAMLTTIYDSMSAEWSMTYSFAENQAGMPCIILEQRHTGGIGYTDVCNYHYCAVLQFYDGVVVPDLMYQTVGSHQTCSSMIHCRFDGKTATDIVEENFQTADVGEDGYEDFVYNEWKQFMNANSWPDVKIVAFSFIDESLMSSNDSMLDTAFDDANFCSWSIVINHEDVTMNYQIDDKDWTGVLGQ